MPNFYQFFFLYTIVLQRKVAELEAIKAQDEADVSGVKQVKKTKKKGKDDFDMLNAALAAAPKTKAQKDAELKKKEKDEQLKAEAAVREAKEAQRKVTTAFMDISFVSTRVALELL